MSKRDISLFFQDILESIEKIENYTEGMTFQDFLRNSLVMDAVVRNLEIIGEAARNIPAEFRQRFKNIPWQRVVGFRNVVIHGYFGVDPEIVWVIVSERLQELKPEIVKILKEPHNPKT
ncbi:MAG: DUF86 domain-containing protein [Thermoplasmata archaeon]|nr:DUF86 domain-containing protein [Thermoplasmata archaeon]